MAVPKPGDLLNILQKSARNGTLLASCEPEVQELMHQIDVLITGRQKEWESNLQTLRAQLQQRERDLSTLRVAIQERNAEVERLKQHNVFLMDDHKARNADYEAQVLRLRGELSRLSHNYEQMKTKRSHTQKLSEGSSRQSLQAKSVENKQLREELQVLQPKCDQLQQEKSSLESRLKLAKMEVSTLQEKCLTLEGELKFARSQLDYRHSLIASSEQNHTTMIKQLESQLRVQLSRMEETSQELKQKDAELRHCQTQLCEKSHSIQVLREQLKRLEQQVRETTRKESDDSHGKLKVGSLYGSGRNSTLHLGPSPPSVRPVSPDEHSATGPKLSSTSQILDKFIREVDSLVVAASPKQTRDYVPLKPLGSGGENGTSFKGHGERRSPTADSQVLSKTVEDMLDRHFEQLDQRLENMFTKDEQI